MREKLNNPVLKSILMLQTAFRKDMTDDQVKLYLVKLSEINPVTLQTAISNLIDTCDWLPSIAAIKREAALLSRKVNGEEEQLNAAEAWDMVYKAAIRSGYDNGLNELPADVRKIAQSFWHDVCYEPSKNLGIVRAQFRDAWNLHVERKSTGERVQAAIDKNPVLTAAQYEARLKIDRAIKKLSMNEVVSDV